MQRFIVSVFIWFVFTKVVNSQNLTTFSVKKTTLSFLLNKIEKDFNITFSYQDYVVKNKIISLKIKNGSLYTILNEITKKTNLVFHKIDTKYYSITPKKFILSKTQNLPKITITNYLTKGIYFNNDATYFIKPKKLGILAGLTEADVFESLHYFPAVSNPNETATQILVRGGNTDQNNILFDGISIYHKGHFYGMISPINPNIVSKITFYNKGTNPKFNERISSVIAIKSNEKLYKKTHLNIGLNGINLDANIALPIRKNKMQLELGLRRSFPEFLETSPFKNYEKKAFQTSITSNSKEKKFSFEDAFFKLIYKPDKKNNFYFSSIYINHNLNFFSYNSKILPFKDILKNSNYGFSVKWKHLWSNKLVQTSLISFSDYTMKYQHKNYDNNVLISNFNKGNQIYDASLKSNLNYYFKPKLFFNFGYQMYFKNASYAFVQKENNNSFVLDSDNNTVKKQKLYSNFILNKKKFYLSLGSSFDYFTDLSIFKIAPRLLFRKTLSKNLKLELSAEFKNQTIFQIDETVLSELTLDNKIWRLANGKEFPIIDGKQYSIGTIFTKNKWTVNMDFYYKNIHGITALSLGYLNPENPNFNTGKQKNYGLEFYAKKEFPHFNFWMSYNLLHIKNKFNNINENQYFTSSKEIKHSVTLSAAYKKNNFETAATWFIHSGRPFTNASLDTNNHFVFNSINTEHLPIYHRLDFSTTYRFSFSKRGNTHGKIGLSIRNLYNQKNFISKEYSLNNSFTQPVTEKDFYGISFTPNFLFRVWF